MKRETLTSSSGHGHSLPHTEPTKLFAVVCAVSVVFFIAYWPRSGSELPGTAALAARRAGPTPPAAAAVQPPSTAAAAAAEVQQQAQGLLNSLVPSWGSKESAAAEAEAGDEEPSEPQQPGRPPASLPEGNASKVQLSLYLMSQCPDANVCEHTFQRVLEKLHPIAHLNTR
jgi:hypothetical protein